MRHLAGLLLAVALAGAVAPPALGQEPKRGGVITVATVGEPTTLDPMQTTADLVGGIMQHVFETLYTFGEGLTIVPLLAESDAVVGDGGRSLTIKLRQGVKFHDGSVMTANDVLASLNRWRQVADRGKTGWAYITAATAPDAHTVVLTLKDPYAPLLALLSLNNNAMAVTPANNQAVPMTKFVGTGPYMLKERRPDQWVILSRFADYTQRSDPPNLYGGKRTAWIEEIRYVPVPDPNTRIEGMLSGQFDYAESLPVAAVARLRGQSRVEPYLMKDFGYPVFSLNNKQGVLSSMKMRQAMLAALDMDEIMKAAFGIPELYAVRGSLYPPGMRLHSQAGAQAYNQKNPTRARQLAAEAGYKGEPIRLLTTQVFEHYYNMALVATEQWKKAGFNIDMQVMDWGTLLARRNNPALYELSTVGAPFLAEPSLIFTAGGERPGFWNSEEKDRIVGAFNAEMDADKRTAMWPEVQRLIYTEVPYIKVGDQGAVRAVSKQLKGLKPGAWAYFWEAWVER
jgi:peptide/nickel transport system substrate-binding protein